MLAIIALFSSCTVDETYEFNDDLSGRYNLEIDYSGLLALMGDEEDMGLPEDESVDETMDIIEKSEGISNSSFSMEDGKGRLAFDFDKVESIQEIGGEAGQIFAGLIGLNLQPKGKKLGVDLSPGDSAAEAMTEYADEAGDIDDSYDEMFSINTHLVFKRPIKKFKSDIATYDKASNTVTFKYNMSDLTNPDVNWTASIKFK
jgi:hypothetical protein